MWMVVTGITFRLLCVLSVQKDSLGQDETLAINKQLLLEINYI